MEFLSYNLVLNSGIKITLYATKTINILTLVLSEKQILNETKNHNPPTPAPFKFMVDPLPLWIQTQWSYQHLIEKYSVIFVQMRGRRGRDRMVVGVTTTYAVSAYHRWCCVFESRSGRSVQHYVIKFVSDLWQVGGFLSVLQFPPPIKLTATI